MEITMKYRNYQITNSATHLGRKKMKTTLAALIITSSFSVSQAFETVTVNESFSTFNEVDAKPYLSVSEEYHDLQRRQADLLANSNELSSLRVQYAHAQLWSLYNDTIFIYWNHELQRRLLQLEQVDNDSVTAAIQSLVYNAVNFSGTTSCNYFGENSLECSIASIQNINKGVHNRSQEIFSSAGAKSWIADWTHRWQQTLLMTTGYIELKQDMDQFLVDNPDVPDYFQLQQDFSVKSAELLADSSVVAKVNDYTQQWSSEMQAILNKTDYSAQMADYNQRSTVLLEADSEYALMNQEGERLTKSLKNLMQEIHSKVVNCTGLGYGNRCFDPQFNYFLQSSLSSYSSTVNQELINSAQLTEKYYQFANSFAKDPKVQSLQKKTANKLQVTLEPVSSELQNAQDTYIERVFSIEIIYDKLADLWDQIKEVGLQLGFIQS